MAKFKVGDKVKVVGQYRATGHNTGNVATVTDVGDSYGTPQYELTYQDGMRLSPLTDRELISANSAPRCTNPVVANALATTARNATITEDDARRWLPELKKVQSEIGEAFRTYESAKAKWHAASEKLRPIARGLKAKDNSNWKEVIRPIISEYGLKPDDFAMLGAYA